MDFWPNDIFADYILSPLDIMTRAGEELSTRTKVLSVEIREKRLADRIVLAFVITNRAYGLSFNLFEASHRPEKTYPAVIDPPVSDIPEFLKRERRIPGSGGVTGIASAAFNTSILGGTPDKIIKNEWICATPDEFTEKLTKLLSLDYIKSNIVSILAPSPVTVLPSGTSEGTHPSIEAQDGEGAQHSSEDGSEA